MLALHTHNSLIFINAGCKINVVKPEEKSPSSQTQCSQQACTACQHASSLASAGDDQSGPIQVETRMQEDVVLL